MQTNLRRGVAFALTSVMIGGALVACGDPSRQASGGEGHYPTRLILADRQAGDGFHPATGYGQTGVSPVYDGLLRPEPSSQDKVPNFVPALAAEMPLRTFMVNSPKPIRGEYRSPVWVLLMGDSSS